MSDEYEIILTFLVEAGSKEEAMRELKELIGKEVFKLADYVEIFGEEDAKKWKEYAQEWVEDD